MCTILSQPTNQIFAQTMLDQLDISTKLNILDILNQFTLNVISIFSAIISFSVDDDIKYIIISIIFTNLEGPIKYYTSVNKKWVPFCVSFGKTCNYLLKFNAQENIMKTIMNHFIMTNMDNSVNIMCISKSFVAFILYNYPEYTCAKFTFLAFDRKSSELSMCTFDKLIEQYCTTLRIDHGACPFNKNGFFQSRVPNKAPFELNNMYTCDVLYYSDNNTYTLAKKHKNQLVDQIMRSLSTRIKTYAYSHENNNLFY